MERSTSSAVGEESEVANANQSPGQNVDEEAAQELMGGNGHDLLLAAVGIISPAERDAIVFEGHEAMVGDGDAVGVAGQVVENVFGAAEGLCYSPGKRIKVVGFRCSGWKISNLPNGTGWRHCVVANG